MAENELQKFINRIFNYIKEKYGYTDEQTLIYLQGYQDCAEENQQSLERRDKMLRDTVAELCEAKRLLKMAVSIINNSFPEVGSCWGCANYDEVNDECKGGAFAECADVCKWQYADEALKLIGEDDNESQN